MRKYTILFIVIVIGLLSACNTTINDNIDQIESIAGSNESKDDNTDEIKSITDNDEDQADMEGIVLDISEHGIKLARNLSPSEYEEIKNESVTKLHNEYVRGERENLGLIDLIYENKNEIDKGDEVEVWIDGDIMEIFPERAKAKKVVVKQ